MITNFILGRRNTCMFCQNLSLSVIEQHVGSAKVCNRKYNKVLRDFGLNFPPKKKFSLLPPTDQKCKFIKT